MPSTSLSDILVCARTSRFTGGEPYGNPWRARCVSSWRDAGSPYGGSDCSANPLPLLSSLRWLQFSSSSLRIHGPFRGAFALPMTASSESSSKAYQTQLPILDSFLAALVSSESLQPDSRFIFLNLTPNVRAEWTGTRGAGGAYAAAVPRVTVTLEPFVRALLRLRFRIFSPTRAQPLHCQPLVLAASAAPTPSFSGTHPRRISGAIPTLRLLKCLPPRPSSPPNQAASAARRRPRSMFNTSLSDILVCARTSAMSGPRPEARQVRTQLACRGSAVRSIELLGLLCIMLHSNCLYAYE
jgi:hypothetical protein